MTAVHEPTAFSTRVGTPAELRGHLDALGGKQQLVMLSFEGVNSTLVAQIAETVTTIVGLIDGNLRMQEDETLQALVKALTPKPRLRPALLKEAKMQSDAQKAVMDAGAEAGGWLSATEVAKVAGLSATNPSAQPNKWKRERRIFAINSEGVDLFPAYGLDPKNSYRPRAGLKPILDIFGETKDAWGLAYWFAAVNGFLGGKRPQDVLLTDPDRVAAAAADEAEGVLHA